MGRGDSSWQDRNHHSDMPRGGKKTPTGKVSPNRRIVWGFETTPTVGTSVGTEDYDDTKATTAVAPLATLRLVRVS